MSKTPYTSQRNDHVPPDDIVFGFFQAYYLGQSHPRKKWVRAVGVIAATWNDLGMTQFLGKTLETLASKFRIQDYPGSSCEWIWILDLMATVPTIFQLTIDSLEWFSVHVASPLRRFAPQMLVLTNLPRLLLSKPEIWWQLIKAFQTALIKAQSGQYDVICTLSECFQNDSTY